MERNEMPHTFTVYRWNDPQTSSDYPILALAEDGVTLLSLGNYGMAFDWQLPDEIAEILAADFVPTGECLRVDLTAVRAALAETFVHGTESGSLAFDDQLALVRLQLVLGEVVPPGPAEPTADDRGPEYVVEGFGSYLRLERARDQGVPVTFMERAMLDTCVSTFAELASQWAPLLTEPPPPRYRAVAEREQAATRRLTDE